MVWACSHSYIWREPRVTGLFLCLFVCFYLNRWCNPESHFVLAGAVKEATEKLKCRGTAKGSREQCGMDAGKIFQQLKALVLPENLGLVFSTHQRLTITCTCNSVPGEAMLSSGLCPHLASM